MKQMNRKLNLIIMSAVLLCTMAGSLQIVAAQRRHQRDPLMVLKHALTSAGAQALTSQQEEQLTSLVIRFRNEGRPKGPNETMQAAKRAYDAAILSGDVEAARSQATIIAEQVAAHVRERLQAEANFRIQALSILNEGQKSSLLQANGTSGLSWLFGALAGGRHHTGPGGPGRFGAPGEGPGPH